MTTQTFNKTDIEQYKGICALGYFIFFIPLFIKNSPFTRFHANQTLVLWLSNIVVCFAISLTILILPYLTMICGSLWVIFSLILTVYGCVNAAKGRAKRLPVIGKFSLLKGSNENQIMPAKQTVAQAAAATMNDTIPCPECGAFINKSKKFCGNCGAKILVKERLCPQCNTPVPQGMNFCGNCGTKYTEPQPKERKCPNCGRIVEEKEKFCMECGTAIE